MGYLREGIGLRAYSQRDPLVEYQREGFDLFSAMMDSIKEESVGYLFNVEVTVDADESAVQDAAAALVSGDLPAQPVIPEGAGAPVDGHDHDHDHDDHRPHITAKGLAAPKEQKKLTYSAPSVDGDAGTTVQATDVDDEFAGVSRNELCPCGSGKKFKRCHGDPANRARLS